MLALADGVGDRDREHLPAGRFRYVDELVRMGADIRTEGHHAVVRGRRGSRGPRCGPTTSGPARPWSSPGLAAEGETVVSDAHHIDRGYERLVEKLAALGADIERK